MSVETGNTIMFGETETGHFFLMSDRPGRRRWLLVAVATLTIAIITASSILPSWYYDWKREQHSISFERDYNAATAIHFSCYPNAWMEDEIKLWGCTYEDCSVSAQRNILYCQCDEIAERFRNDGVIRETLEDEYWEGWDESCVIQQAA